MKKETSLWFGHILILVTVLVWGGTYVSTKVLVDNAMGPIEIALYRFVIAYAVLFLLYPKFEKTDLLTELRFVVFAFFGITLYFLLENNALKISSPPNVAFIVSTAPLWTAILAHIFTKDEKIGLNTIIGVIFALFGIAMIVFNGKIILKLNPVGDFLAFLSAVSWAVYSIIIKREGKKYNMFYINRKIFFYGIILILPCLWLFQEKPNFQLLTNINVVLNLLFLGVIASALCYVMWQKALNILGIIKTSNYIYFSPLITAVISVIVLESKITFLMIIGAVSIFIGVFISSSFKKEGLNE